MSYARPMVTVGILGGSGYTGVELLRLAAAHPDLEVVYATADTAAGERAADVHPALAAAYPALRYARYDPADAAGLDLVFTSLPSGTDRGDRPRPAAQGRQGRRSRRRLPPPGPHGLPTLVRLGAPGARVAGRGGARHPRAHTRRGP